MQLKYFIDKLSKSFFTNQLTYIKTKNLFNKINVQFNQCVKKSNQNYHLLLPLVGYFNTYSQNFNQGKKSKEEKEFLLMMFYDQTDTMICFWNDTFEESKYISIKCNRKSYQKKILLF